MALNSVDQLIRSMEHQPNWQQYRRFQRLLSHWPTLVGPAVATKARPTGIQHNILHVGVCNATWAQNLAFERQHLLKKLNAAFSDAPFRDIRFSTAQWPSKGRSPSKSELTIKMPEDDSEVSQLWRAHPCQAQGQAQASETPQSSLPGFSSNQTRRPSEDWPNQPEAAFQRWADTVQRRSHHLPLCPQCRCSTPKGELQRWSVCSLCAAKRWGASRRR